MAEALRPWGVRLGARHVRRYLASLRAGYRRTAQTVSHKQNPRKVRRAKAVLGNLKKALAGRLQLHFLDECGFSPSLPTGYSWCLQGRRKRVRYECPQGRRVNVPAACEPSADMPGLIREAFERTLTGENQLAFLRNRLPGAEVPRVVVLDTAGMHIGRLVKAARKELATQGVHLDYLPSCSPELNRIEAVFKQVKHHEMPVRSHASRDALRHAAEVGFDAYRHRLQQRSDKQPRLAV